MYQYKATCIRVIDGDTIEVKIDLGFYIYHTVRIRMNGYDAPELFSGTARDKGALAKEKLEELILWKSLRIQTIKDKRSFDRWIAEVFLDTSESENVNLLMEEYCKTL